MAKLNGTGSALLYSTRLGGEDNELPEDVEVDAAGNVYVGGSTRSSGFPTTPGAFDTTQNGGAFDERFDLFVTKLNPTGSGLVYSTFLGGAGPAAVAPAADGNVWLAGNSGPSGTTTPDAFAPFFKGGTTDAYVAKLNAPAPRCCTRASSAARSPRAAPTSRSTPPATSTSPAARSRRTSSPRPGPSIAPGPATR